MHSDLLCLVVDHAIKVLRHRLEIMLVLLGAASS